MINSDSYKMAQVVMQELFAKDYQFALATSANNIPSVRFVDTFYDEGCFYIVTYGKSRKVSEIEGNPNVALTFMNYSFSGIASNIGHPLDPKNLDIREKLIEAFEPWYFKHNNESDPNMCYVKVELDQGFFYKDGQGYKVDYVRKVAECFPFEFDIVLTV